MALSEHKRSFVNGKGSRGKELNINDLRVKDIFITAAIITF